MLKRIKSLISKKEQVIRHFAIDPEKVDRIEVKTVQTLWGFGNPRIEVSMSLNGHRNLLHVEDNESVRAQTNSIERIWESLYKK